VIDGAGLVVAPGFIDVHTHYDAQLTFEPTASPSSWHGVTTVVIGNCGFSLAPSTPADLPWLLRTFARVEEMQGDCLLEGVTFEGGTTAELLDHLEGQLGVNVIALVGHCAIRRAVMGTDASQRVATPSEIETMQQLLHQELVGGGYGFSTAQLDVHVDHEGLPVTSNVAAPDELVALSSVLARHQRSVIEFAPSSSLPGYTEQDRRLLFDMARASRAPVNVNMIDWFPGFTEGWARNLAAAEDANRKGLRIIPMMRANPQDFFFRIADTFIFDDVPAIRATLLLPPRELEAALRDPCCRDAMRRDLANVRRSIDFSWEKVSVSSVQRLANRGIEGRSVDDLARERRVDEFDVLLDIALADDLGTVFRIDRSQGPAHLELRKKLAQHPLLLAGASDAGAHVQRFCGADYPSRLLTELVPDPLTLEQGVHKLTGQPAAMLGLRDRGVLAPGAVADIVVFDPDGIGTAATRFLADLPGGARRIVHEPQGYEAVIVGGQVLIHDGSPTGALPGKVLRRV
jgi:N-acyl-D-aspartate/D-glutamate deacylase